MKVITPQDFELTPGCARWVAPDGAVFLELPHYLTLSMFLAAGGSASLRKATPAQWPFVLKVISFYQVADGVAHSMYGRIQFPSGHFLTQTMEDLNHFYGLNEFGRLMDPHVVMPPASQIRANVNNRGVANATAFLFFEGVVRIPLVQGANAA